MNGGFSFDGIEIGQLGLEYAPENKNTYVYKPSEFSIADQTFDGHDGGYYYGYSLKPKVFTLRCFYEGEHINEGILTKIYSTFKIGRIGKLIFAKRDWCWYMATVVDIDSDNLLNYETGFIVITMKAYYPYARTDEYYIEDGDENSVNKLNNSALMIGDEWMPEFDLTESGSISSSVSVDLINVGTKSANVDISIAGNVGGGVHVVNETNGTRADFVVMDKAKTTTVGKYVLCSAFNGMTILTNGSTKENGCLYHDGGFLRLDSAFPIDRDIHAEGSSGNNYVTVEETLFEDPVGRTVFKNDKSFSAKIIGKNGNRLTIDKTLTDDISGTFSIMKTNRITISGDDSFELTKLRLDFKPTFD